MPLPLVWQGETLFRKGVLGTISLRLEAYERLRQARRRPGESFSEVVMRAQWPDAGITAAELLELYQTQGPFFSAAALDRIKAAKTAATPPEGKWVVG